MWLLTTQIEIDAPVERVWQALTDFSGYGEWNSYLPRVEGDLVVGDLLAVTVAPARGAPRVFSREVCEVLEGDSFSWRGIFLHQCVFMGRHSFRVTPRGEGGSLFENVECFSGVLVPFFWPLLTRSVRGRFEAMNQGLREFVES